MFANRIFFIIIERKKIDLNHVLKNPRPIIYTWKLLLFIVIVTHVNTIIFIIITIIIWFQRLLLTQL